MIPLKSILHTENISVTFYTSNRYLLWQQMSKQPLNCPCVYHTDTKQMSKEWLYEWTLHGAFCKCSGWLDDIFHRQYHDVKVTFSNSLRINKAKTKKMTTVTVVWILDTNYHKICELYSSLNFSHNFRYYSFEKPYQKRHAMFHSISRHWEVGWKTKAQPSFLTPTSTTAFISQTSKTSTPCLLIY